MAMLNDVVLISEIIIIGVFLPFLIPTRAKAVHTRLLQLKASKLVFSSGHYYW
jgi:hypothetical protein